MKHKWTLFCFSRGDFKTVERYLNKQAEKGWELERTGIFAKWKRTERTGLRYCVDLAKPKQDREDRLDYVEFCREGGWELAAFAGQMYIFKSMPDSYAIPVQTDPELEQKNYKKYYIRNTILSVVYILALIAVYAFIGLSMGARFDNLAADLRYGWMKYWTVGAICFALPVWGLLAVWRIGHFIGHLIHSGGEKVRSTHSWAMWLDAVLTALSLLASILVLLGLFLDKVLAGLSSGASFYVILFLQAALFVYNWAEIDKELFRGEKRRLLAGAVCMIVLLAGSIAADVAARYGEWTTNWFSRLEERAVEVYDSSYEQPLVHTEDVGLPFDFIDGGHVDVEHKLLPMGDWWKLEYFYPSGMPGDGVWGISSITVQCPSRKQAERTAAALANKLDVETRYAVWPENGLESIELDWADQAWYGECRYEDDTIYILVLCVDKQATRLTYPVPLLTDATEAVIRSELGK